MKDNKCITFGQLQKGDSVYLYANMCGVPTIFELEFVLCIPFRGYTIFKENKEILLKAKNFNKCSNLLYRMNLVSNPNISEDEDTLTIKMNTENTSYLMIGDDEYGLFTTMEELLDTYPVTTIYTIPCDNFTKMRFFASFSGQYLDIPKLDYDVIEYSNCMGCGYHNKLDMAFIITGCGNKFTICDTHGNNMVDGRQYESIRLHSNNLKFVCLKREITTEKKGNIETEIDTTITDMFPIPLQLVKNKRLIEKIKKECQQ